MSRDPAVTLPLRAGASEVEGEAAEIEQPFQMLSLRLDAGAAA